MLTGYSVLAMPGKPEHNTVRHVGCSNNKNSEPVNRQLRAWPAGWWMFQPSGCPWTHGCLSGPLMLAAQTEVTCRLHMVCAPIRTPSVGQGLER